MANANFILAICSRVVARLKVHVVPVAAAKRTHRGLGRVANQTTKARRVTGDSFCRTESLELCDPLEF